MLQEMSSSGDVREVLGRVIKALMNKEIEVDRAAVIVKAAEEITSSLYSEAKISVINQSLGREVPALGSLPITGAKQLK